MSQKEELCGFCGAPNPKFKIECKTFQVKSEAAAQLGTDLTLNSIDEWMSCELCYIIVKENNREKLLDRSITEFIARNPTAAQFKDELKKEVAILQAGFWKNKL